MRTLAILTQPSPGARRILPRAEASPPAPRAATPAPPRPRRRDRMVQSQEARPERRAVGFLQGFKNFLMQGDIIVIAVGLVIALAFSTLIKAFTDSVITPLVNAAGGGGTNGLGVRVRGQLVDFGAFVSE